MGRFSRYSSKMALVRSNVAIMAALLGVLELLGALGCLICTLMFGNITNTTINQGRLYSKYYDSASPTRRYGENGGTYWWAGLPFLLPGMIGIGAFATRKLSVMMAFMISNIISFFCGIALAIFVGLFYNLWKVPMTAYEAKDCIFEYHEPTFQTFCQCKITADADIKLMDADRLWIFVQGCDEVETINIMLVTIISLSIVTAIIAFGCSFIACYALKFPEKPKNAPRQGFNQLPADFLLTQKNQQDSQPLQPAPKARDDYPDTKPKAQPQQYSRQEPTSYTREEKPTYRQEQPTYRQEQPTYRQEQPKSYTRQEQQKPYREQERAPMYQEKPKPYKEQYATEYPPPYPDTTDEKKRYSDSDDDEGDAGDGWL